MNYLMKARAVLTKYIQTKEQTPEVVPALASMTETLLEHALPIMAILKAIPEAAVSEMR